LKRRSREPRLSPENIRREQWRKTRNRRGVILSVLLWLATIRALLSDSGVAPALAISLIALVVGPALVYPPCPACGSRVGYGKPGGGWPGWRNVLDHYFVAYCPGCDRIVVDRPRPRRF
jgi:hypothetical protein